MPFVIALEVLVGAVLVVVGLLLAIAVRRRLLQRGGGTVDLSLRLNARSRGRGWVLGVGKFSGDELHWYRVFSLSMRPRKRLSRRTLVVGQRRQPTGPEAFAMLKGAVVIECQEPSGAVEMALEERALTGFLAWLESQPPGTRQHL